jgi:hypothetical protein
VSAKQGHAALRHFRTAAGGEKSFPAIEIFTNHSRGKTPLNPERKGKCCIMIDDKHVKAP